jgi:hypothetical protein
MVEKLSAVSIVLRNLSTTTKTKRGLKREGKERECFFFLKLRKILL